MGHKAAAAAKSGIKKGDKLERQGGSSEIMKGDKLGTQGGSGSQERNHEGRQAWETSWQRHPRAKSCEPSFTDEAAAAAKSGIKKGDKLERQGGSCKSKATS